MTEARERVQSQSDACLAAVLDGERVVAYRILVVDDQSDARDLLDFMLRWNGHDVDPVGGGPEALELLASRSYDVILTDLHMPGMSGEDLYRRIEHGWPHLAPRVVFVTAAPTDSVFRAQFGGGAPVLTKPYTPARLLQMIEHVVARDV